MPGSAPVARCLSFRVDDAVHSWFVVSKCAQQVLRVLTQTLFCHYLSVARHLSSLPLSATPPSCMQPSYYLTSIVCDLQARVVVPDRTLVYFINAGPSQ